MAAPPADMSGKGLLYVNSRITSPLLNEETFFKWYDDDHIVEILGTSGMPTAYRFINESAKSPSSASSGGEEAKPGRPYLAIYPLQDIQFLRTPEFAGISVTSDMLPGESKLIYDLVDFDVRYYSLVQVYDPTKKGPGQTKSVFYAHFALKEGFPDTELEGWYNQEHLEALSKVTGYLRTTRYKLVWGRNSDMSRAFKGVASKDAKEESAPSMGRLPEWFALHEFETEQVDMKELQDKTGSEWTKKIFDNCDDMAFGHFVLAREHGKKGIFAGETV